MSRIPAICFHGISALATLHSALRFFGSLSNNLDIPNHGVLRLGVSQEVVAAVTRVFENAGDGNHVCGRGNTVASFKRSMLRFRIRCSR